MNFDRQQVLLIHAGLNSFNLDISGVKVDGIDAEYQQRAYSQQANEQGGTASLVLHPWDCVSGTASMVLSTFFNTPNALISLPQCLLTQASSSYHVMHRFGLVCYQTV